MVNDFLTQTNFESVPPGQAPQQHATIVSAAGRAEPHDTGAGISAKPAGARFADRDAGAGREGRKPTARNRHGFSGWVCFADGGCGRARCETALFCQGTGGRVGPRSVAP
jgi:hypothetical protein